jgi:hypothetical protein
MKRFLFLAAIVTTVSSPAFANDTYIPSGTGYSPDIDKIPEFNSDRDRLNATTDAIETEIYRRAYEKQLNDSYIRRFFSDPESGGSDFTIDY